MSEVISEWQKRHAKWPDWIDFFFDFYLSNYTVTLPLSKGTHTRLQAPGSIQSEIVLHRPR